MKVLLSAYACEPGKGSEPGIGWHWAIEIARRGHRVTVLTRANNRANIEAGAAHCGFPANVEFAYYDLPGWVCALKRRLGVTLPYYAWWQWGAYRFATKLHSEHRFDLVHHITFGAIRHFSFMGRLGLPFLLGPVGGGETSPFWLRWHTGWRGGLIDTLRDVANAGSRFDPIARQASRHAAAIYAKTPETLRVLPRECRSKAQWRLEMGSDYYGESAPASPVAEDRKRILFVGRFIYWKGMALGLQVFARALAADPALSLTLVGKGREEERWRRLAERLGVSNRVTWISWLPQPELQKLYASHGLLLFPSLHDSSGSAVLEALAHGLPVVCLKLGGPGVIVDDSCGRAIDTRHGSVDRLMNDMAQAILDFTARPDAWAAASARARAATARWTWSDRVEGLGAY